MRGGARLLFPGEHVATRDPRRHGWAVTVVLGAALVLRLAHWVAMRRAPFIGSLVMDSQEYDRWARQIAGGDWLGHGVFFQAPLYPYLVGLLYLVVGPRLDAVYLAQIACAVAGCYALYRAGAAIAGERVGLAAAALAAVYGPFLFYDVQLLKESLAVSVVCFLLWALAMACRPAMRPSSSGSAGSVGSFDAAGSSGAAGSSDASTRGTRSWGPWLLVGALVGVLALLRENALLVAPCLLPLAWVSCRRRAAAALACGALLAGVVVVLAPVALRNGVVGGAFLPTTFQGGVNFYIGNNAQADGTYRPIVPGKQVPELERREPIRLAEAASGRPLTASEVSAYWLERSLTWVRGHPGDFLVLTLRKVGLFWSWYEWPDAVDYYLIRGQSPIYRLPLLEFGGVTILLAVGLGFIVGRRMPGWAPVLVFAVAWMASTVLFFLFARYRLPVIPALLLVAALPIVGLGEALAAARAAADDAPRRAARRRALALGLAVAAAFVLPRLAGFAPRLDLVHFNLARLAEEQGDADLARRHYLAVLDASPGDFLAWLDLGSLAARRRDLPEALRCYRRAAELEPGSDDAQANLGAIYLALGDPRRAETHLGQALALNSRSAPALQNAALLRLRLGDVAGARDLNRRALDVEPTNVAALRLRARLERLTNLPAQGSPSARWTPGAPSETPHP